MRVCLAAAVFTALALLPAPSQAQVVASDASYTITRSTATFSSIAGLGTRLDLIGSDDAAFSAAISPFSFYGTTYGSVWASTNGLLAFGGMNTGFSNQNLASPVTGSPVIAAFWDDLVMDATGDFGLWRRQVGDVTTIEWNGARFFGNANDRVTFQAVINSNTGSVDLNYGPRTATAIDPGRMSGSSATIGIRGPVTFALVGFNQQGTIATGDRLTIAPITTTVPEPTSLALLGIGLATLIVHSRRRVNRA